MFMRTSAWVLCGVVLISGCSPTAWDVHAFTATGVRDGCNTMKAALREHHTDTMRAAVMELVRAPDEADEVWDARRLAALQDADARWRTDHAAWQTASGACAEASTTYSRAAYEGLTGHGDPSRIVPVARDAARAMLTLVDLLRDAAFPDLPDLGPAVRQFLGLSPAGQAAAVGQQLAEGAE